MKKLSFLLFSLFFLSVIIPVAYCDADINIMEIPQQVGESLGIPEPNTAFIGGLFMSCIVFLALVMPTLLLRNKSVSIIMVFMVLSFLVAISWLPVWIMLITVLMVTGLMASKMKRWFS